MGIRPELSAAGHYSIAQKAIRLFSRGALLYFFINFVQRCPSPLRLAAILAGVLSSTTPTIAAPTQPPELCAPPAGVTLNDHFVQPASTREMITLIQQIYDQADPLRNPFRSSDQVPLLQARDAKVGTNFDEQLHTKLQLALHLLQAGRYEESMAQHDAVARFMAENNRVMDDRMRANLLIGKAVCHLRVGETANCIHYHNAESCLFPIRGGGIHQLPEGSRGAVAVLTELLEQTPGDLRARWLLNIAAMTLGEYPDKVPARWRLDPASFASECEFPRFPDIAANVGLNVDSWAGGIVTEDFDRDGFLDLMVSSWGFTEKDQLRVFRSNGDGTFTERSKQAGLAGLLGGLNLIHGDFNNDGHADVLVLRGAWLGPEGHYPFSLLRNNGDFTFTDVTKEAGLLHFKPTQTAAWFDYNADGWLDIFVGNEATGADKTPCELFRNNGDGTFTECAAEQGVDIVAFVKGAVSGDFNNDGRPDLFLSVKRGPKRLLRNDGPAGTDRSPRAKWKFTDVTEAAGITGPHETFPCWFWDYDNDDWQDIMVIGYALRDVGDVFADYTGRPSSSPKARLYRNNGDGTFTDVSKAAGVSRLLPAMGVNFGDLDNDGWLDFYAGTGDPEFATLVPSRMFRFDGRGRFLDVTTAGGFGQLQKGHGIAFADLDNDGDQDVFSKVGGAVEADNYQSQLFLNPGNGNRWLKLQLEGTHTNRVAIGARIKIVVRERGVERIIRRTVGTGASFGANPLRQEIGLGQADAIEHVEVFWPVPGVVETLTGFEINRAYFIRQGARNAVPVELKSFVLPLTPLTAGGHRHH